MSRGGFDNLVESLNPQDEEIRSERTTLSIASQLFPITLIFVDWYVFH